MKKILAIAAIITLIAVFTLACNGNATTTSPTPGDEVTTPTTTGPTETPEEPAKEDTHEDDEDEHEDIEPAPEEIHEFLEAAISAVKSAGDAGTAIEELESARAIVTDSEVIEQIEHILEELEAGDLEGAIHEMEDWLGEDEHEDDEEAHSGELAPEEIHEFLEAALAAIKSAGDISTAIEELEEARATTADSEVIEHIEHIIEEIEAGELDEAVHELEDWLGEDTH